MRKRYRWAIDVETSDEEELAKLVNHLFDAVRAFRAARQPKDEVILYHRPRTRALEEKAHV